MAKKYTVKDLNKNGKIDGWEQGKYDAINSATPMKMGYAMKMGAHSNISPTNFKTKDAMLMAKSPMYMIGGDPKKNEYVDPSLTRAYGDYANPKSPSYIVNVTKNPNDPYADKMDNLNQGYEQGGYSKSGSYDEIMYEAGLGLGKGLRNMLKPKDGTEGYYRQQERKANRAEERFKRGGVDYGNKKYVEARKNSAKFKNKKGTQTKVGKGLRDLKKKIFK
jgi:hypothetical protein